MKMKENTLPELLSVSTIAKTRIFELESVDLRFSNGELRTYERMKPASRGAVMVIPIYQDQLVLVKEYAVGPERYELGFPKGAIDLGESPSESANRELQEEIGFKAERLTPLRELYSSPSHMFALMHVFIAEELSPSTLAGDEPEPLEIVYIPLANIDELLTDPTFSESRNLAALFLFKAWLQTQPKLNAKKE